MALLRQRFLSHPGMFPAQGQDLQVSLGKVLVEKASAVPSMEEEPLLENRGDALLLVITPTKYWMSWVDWGSETGTFLQNRYLLLGWGQCPVTQCQQHWLIAMWIPSNYSIPKSPKCFWRQCLEVHLNAFTVVNSAKCSSGCLLWKQEQHWSFRCVLPVVKAPTFSRWSFSLGCCRNSVKKMLFASWPALLRGDRR